MIVEHIFNEDTNNSIQDVSPYCESVSHVPKLVECQQHIGNTYIEYTLQSGTNQKEITIKFNRNKVVSIHTPSYRR